MSILINGMKMPRWCCSCELNVDDTYCCVTETAFSDNERIKEGFNYQEKRLPNCPLIEVLPHSRLIYADELQRQFERMANEEWNKNIAVSAASCFDDAAVIVEDAPTIIEAEE